MSILNRELTDIINNPSSFKSVATVSREGIPHAAYKGSLHVEGELLVFYDLIQNSQINKNLVNAIWYDKKVAVQVYLEDGADKKCFLIQGKPVKCVTAGKEFEKVYLSLQDKFGKDTDLSAIWYIEPEKVRDETLRSRKKEEEEKYPYIMHLDRIVSV